LPFRTEKGEKEKFSQSSFSDVKKNGSAENNWLNKVNFFQLKKSVKLPVNSADKRLRARPERRQFRFSTGQNG